EIIPPELARYDLRQLTINYRSPAENDGLAEALLAEIAPDLPSPRSLRRSGRAPTIISSVDPLTRGLELADLELAQHPQIRVACIVAEQVDVASMSEAATDPRLFLLTARQAKGLEFDVVIVAEPADIADQDYGLNLLYVAATRATQALVLVHHRPLPEPLARGLESFQPSPAALR
ncbi:MAG: ATP-binding domain-containing protein, partial [Acidimicrobiia bacterium]|nr:ATP-binding domain-containing protein [Acidimicrobiia bacterium]